MPIDYELFEIIEIGHKLKKYKENQMEFTPVTFITPSGAEVVANHKSAAEALRKLGWKEIINA